MTLTPTVCRCMSLGRTSGCISDTPNSFSLKEVVAEQALEIRLLKKSMIGDGATTNEISRIRNARDHQDRRAVAPVGAQDAGAEPGRVRHVLQWLSRADGAALLRRRSTPTSRGTAEPALSAVSPIRFSATSSSRFTRCRALCRC